MTDNRVVALRSKGYSINLELSWPNRLMARPFENDELLHDFQVDLRVLLREAFASFKDFAPTDVPYVQVLMLTRYPGRVSPDAAKLITDCCSCAVNSVLGLQMNLFEGWMPQTDSVVKQGKSNSIRLLVTWEQK